VQFALLADSPTAPETIVRVRQRCAFLEELSAGATALGQAVTLPPAESPRAGPAVSAEGLDEMLEAEAVAIGDETTDRTARLVR
jgi:hypothetical protein